MADPVALAEVQGFILRSYGMDALRLFALRVQDVRLARKALGQLPIASGRPWDQKPDFCVNAGITFAGLQALQLPDSTLNSFPEEFRLGAAQRAALVGDTADSAAEAWLPGFGDNSVHVLVTIYAQNAAILEAQSTVLTDLWAGALTPVLIKDAGMLPGNVAHFGFRDGFSQPTVDGGLPNPLGDPLPKAPAGEFILGYPSQFNQFSYPVPQPDELGLNGSYLALRILEQDCAAFEQLLQSGPEKFGIDGEKMAAKMVGRWRNGVPLHASPDTDSPNPPLPLDQFNNYDYVDDAKGFRCPVGAHMRRKQSAQFPDRRRGGDEPSDCAAWIAVWSAV